MVISSPAVGPPCPSGHKGRVVLAGRRKRHDGFFSRPLYWCYPSGSRGGPESHRFTDTRQHRTADHPAGAACHECGTPPQRIEGPMVPARWEFSSPEIAEALLLVGQGLSYRQAAAHLRREAHRFLADEAGLPLPSLDGKLVRLYLDAFAEFVLEKVEHRRWPRVLLLDALPMRVRDLDRDGNKLRGGQANGAFLAACGYSEPVEHLRRVVHQREGVAARPRQPKSVRRPHLWRVRISGGLDAVSWRDFLDELDGEPEWVVTDGDGAVRKAVREKWGGRPILYACEGHLVLNYERAARQDKLPPVTARALFGHALDDPSAWRAFIGRLLDQPPDTIEHIAALVGRRSAGVLEQMGLRREGYPRGTGAMEAALMTLDGWIGNRRQTFQNVRRINLALGLMRAQIAGHADAAAYTRIISDKLKQSRGRPRIEWARHFDRDGRRGLDTLTAAAADRAASGLGDYFAQAQNRSMAIKIVLADAYRASLGLSPLQLNDTGKTISVRSQGQMLSERPEVAREWDHAANGKRTPETTKATSRTTAAWVCALNPEHRWRATPGNRSYRLTGCPRCARERQNRAGRAPSQTLSEIVGLTPDEEEGWRTAGDLHLGDATPS